MDKKLYGLDSKTISALLSVFRKQLGIQKILLYGSRALGNYRDGSDIDLTLIAPGWDLKKLFKLENEIDDLMLPYKVDLSLLHKINNKSLEDHINRVGIEFYLAK
jgi:predicted nucleotidyltransferase